MGAYKLELRGGWFGSLYTGWTGSLGARGQMALGRGDRSLQEAHSKAMNKEIEGDDQRKWLKSMIKGGWLKSIKTIIEGDELRFV